MTAKNIHPDFTPAGAVLSPVQLKWLKANGIEVSPNTVSGTVKGKAAQIAAPGFFFYKGDLCIWPIMATDDAVETIYQDPEDSEYVSTHDRHPRLKDALRALANA